MLFETFKTIREALSTIPEIKSVQWYNKQYDGTIYVTPVAYVEYHSRIPLEKVGGPFLKGEFAVRVHLVSSIVSGQDRSIPDQQILDHEAIAEKIYEKTAWLPVTIGGSSPVRLVPAGWQHEQKMTGFLITMIDFKATAMEILKKR